MKRLIAGISYLVVFIAGGVAMYFMIPLLQNAPAVSHHDTDDSSETKHPVKAKQSVSFQYDASIQKESAAIFSNDPALYSYVKKFGLQQSITHLHELTALYGDCHQPAHKAGRFAYDLFSREAFVAAGSECHSGGLHGAIEAYFHENGIANLTEDIDQICRPEANSFFDHQCIHGIGHGLMAWSDYALPDVLKYCDRLPRLAASCWSGAFMENVVGGLAQHHHDGGSAPSKYLSNDPHYPCTIVEDKYKAGCYFYQTSRMIQLFDGDFTKVAAACSETNQAYQMHCFSSMGRDVGGRFRGDPVGAINSCGSVLKGVMRIHCLNGAVQDAFWDASGQDNAMTFCKKLVDTAEKESCYKTTLTRATQILTTQSDRNQFCQKAEDPFRKSCLLGMGL